MKKLRVWHIPQVPGKTFRVNVESIVEAKKILDVLAIYDLFQYQNRIKPDYSNAQGVEMFEDGEWTDFFDDGEYSDFDEMCSQKKIDFVKELVKDNDIRQKNI